MEKKFDILATLFAFLTYRQRYSFLLMLFVNPVHLKCNPYFYYRIN